MDDDFSNAVGRGGAPDATGGGGEDMTVGRASALLGVSVRTLHHWDATGLVTPSERTWSGYRLYSRADLARAQRVLVYRETGMSLAQVRRVLNDPTVDAVGHLARQRDLLESRIARLQRMVRAVDDLARKESTMTPDTTPMTPQQRADILGTDWDPAWETEAEERWGHTDDWQTSAARRAAQTPEQLTADKARLDAIENELAAAMREGVEPGSERADALAEEHRAALTWFDVTHAKHAILARGYVADPRFTAHYDRLEPGLATWLQAVIDANAQAHGVDPAGASWE